MMKEKDKVIIEDSFDFTRKAMRVFMYILMGLIAILAVVWIITYSFLVKILSLLIFPIVIFLIWYFFKD